MEDIVQSISISKLLIAILEEHGSITISTEKFFNANGDDKELVFDYNEEGPSFTIGLRNKDEQ
jgi:hypothetical protein